MYLVDTNAISELRKGSRADDGVVRLLKGAELGIFLTVQVVGELRQGVENLRHRRAYLQAQALETWLETVLDVFALRILVFDAACAYAWGRLMSPSHQNPIDKQIAAIALVYDLAVVTRNTNRFAGTGVRMLNPFVADAPPTQTAN